MNESDFPQFDDPRVRAVMAAAANLVEETLTVLGEYEADRKLYNGEQVMKNLAETLATALFAAQHSKPHVPTCTPWTCTECEVRHHEKPIKFDRWGYGMAETNQFLVDGSKPGGKAFIGAIEETISTCLGGCECPRCGIECDYPLKRCTKCHGDGLTHCEYCEAKK